MIFDSYWFWNNFEYILAFIRTALSEGKLNCYYFNVKLYAHYIDMWRYFEQSVSEPARVGSSSSLLSSKLNAAEKARDKDGVLEPHRECCSASLVKVHLITAIYQPTNKFWHVKYFSMRVAQDAAWSSYPPSNGRRPVKFYVTSISVRTRFKYFVPYCFCDS